MKSHYTIALAMLTGIDIGALAVQGLHAQAKPPAYVIVDVATSNEEVYQKLNRGSKIAEIVMDGGGKFLTRGGSRVVTIEGAPASRILLVAFENLDKAQATFTSAAFKEARQPFNQYAKFRIVAVEGLPQ